MFITSFARLVPIIFVCKCSYLQPSFHTSAHLCVRISWI